MSALTEPQGPRAVTQPQCVRRAQPCPGVLGVLGSSPCIEEKAPSLSEAGTAGTRNTELPT